jgi:hypothetical protein
VEYENVNKTKVIFYAYSVDNDGDTHFVGKTGKNVGDWEDWQFEYNVKPIAPIPPKPYEFKVGDRVMVFETGKTFEVWTRVGLDEKYGDEFGNSYYWYELAPALPEDEECEVVEVTDDNCDIDLVKNEINVTKPDGKKLKIKVIEK